MLLSKFIVKKGYLVKSPPFGRSASGFPKRWKKRFFVLYFPDDIKGAVLYYFKDEETFEEGKPEKGKIAFAECVDLRKQERRLFEKDYLVSLSTSSESRKHRGRVFHFCAESEKLQQEWFEAMQNLLRQSEEANKSPETERKEPVCYIPARPTSLELRIAETKRNIELERSPGTGKVPTEDEAIFIENGKPELPHRVSKSSGYASGFSEHSGCSSESRIGSISYGSDRWSGEYRSSSSSNQDLFGFGDFTGPRISWSTKQRSLSMGNLLDSLAEAESRESTLERLPRTSSSASRRIAMENLEEREESEDSEDIYVTPAEAGRSMSDPRN